MDYRKTKDVFRKRRISVCAFNWISHLQNYRKAEIRPKIWYNDYLFQFFFFFFLYSKKFSQVFNNCMIDITIEKKVLLSIKYQKLFHDIKILLGWKYSWTNVESLDLILTTMEKKKKLFDRRDKLMKCCKVLVTPLIMKFINVRLSLNRARAHLYQVYRATRRCSPNDGSAETPSLSIFRFQPPLETYPHLFPHPSATAASSSSLSSADFPPSSPEIWTDPLVALTTTYRTISFTSRINFTYFVKISIDQFTFRRICFPLYKSHDCFKMLKIFFFSLLSHIRSWFRVQLNSSIYRFTIQ